MRYILIALVITLGITYPFIIYFGIQHTSPAVLAIALAAMAGLRFASTRHRNKNELILVIAGIAYSLILAMSNSELLLRLYPVVISLLFSAIFALSLRADESFIEHVSIAAGKTITYNAKRYTWYLTLLWSVLLFVNAMIALYLALRASLSTWAVYCGFVSYLLFAVFFAIEYIYRCYFIRRYGA